MTKPQLQPGLPGRKEACPCGSQKKYKTCCGRRAKSTAPKPAAQPRPVRIEDFIAACNAAMQAFEAGKLKQAVYVERGTMDNAASMRLADKPDDDAPYFALVLVPGWEQRP